MLNSLKIVFLLSLIHSLAYGSSVQCEDVYNSDTRILWNTKFNQLMSTLIYGKEGQSPLYFYWHRPYPPLVKLVGGKMMIYPAAKRMRVYHTDEDASSPTGLMYINKLFAKRDISNATLIDYFLQKFAPKASKSIVESVISVENQIARNSNERQSFGYVGIGPEYVTRQLLGAWRVYEGTKSFSDSDPRLPFELGYKNISVEVKTVTRLEKIRNDNPNLKIYEIGKRFLDYDSATFSKESIERTRSILDLFLLRFYVDLSPPESLFFVQVSDPKLAEKLNMRYGFRIVEEINIPGQVETDYILEATGMEMSTHLRRSFDIPELRLPVEIVTEEF